jgi:hypothetical protein
MPSVTGKLEINIKISELPNNVRSVKNDWKEFMINAEGQSIKVRIRPRIWDKMQSTANRCPQWVASITGKMGTRIKDGFELQEPAVQIFEKKSKPTENTTEEDVNGNVTTNETDDTSKSD